MTKISPLFAKQAIFDAGLQTVAYELLFRGTASDRAQFTDGDQATSHVLFYAFGQNRIEEIIGDRPAYINFTPQLLIYPPPLPPEKLVIEVLETVKADKWVLDGIKNLKQQGYRIALDDFFINDQTRALIKYADIIKVDVMALSEQKLRSYAKLLQPLNVTLLAEKIETKEVFDLCVELGFSLFQGYFLAKPVLIEGQKISEGKQAILKLLSVLLEDEVEVAEVVNAISTDPRLTFRILKIVNSTAYKTPNPIESLSQAVTMLGLSQIRSWAAFLLLTGEDQEKPIELSLLCMSRAKFCEAIGYKLGNKALADGCFTAGLLSTFDAFLNISLDELLPQLNLSNEIHEAISEYKGMIGSVLSLCLYYEKAHWEQVANHPLLSGMYLAEPCLNDCYLLASKWALETIQNF